MRLMKNCVLLLLIFQVMIAEEVDRVVSNDSSGRIVTVITYKNEKDGMIKKELYGVAPKYTDRIVYYNEANQNYLEKCSFNDLVYDDPAYPEGKPTSGFFVYNELDPDGKGSSKFTRNGSYVEEHTYYKKNNKERIKEEITISDNRVVLSAKRIYSDDLQTISKRKEVTFFYNQQREIVQIATKCFKNDQYIDEQINEYDPPTFSEKDQKPKRVLVILSENPTGVLRREIMYDNKGWRMTLESYDPDKTKDRFTRIMLFYEGNILRRKIIYFDDVLFKGKIYFISSWYNDDGSMKSAELYDKNDQLVNLN